MISSRRSAAFDAATGILHLAGDDVSDATARTIEFTSTQIVHTARSAAERTGSSSGWMPRPTGASGRSAR